MEEENIALSRIHGWNDPWTAIHDKADMTDQPFIQDGKRSGAIFHRAFGMPLNLHGSYKNAIRIQLCTTTKEETLQHKCSK